MTLPDIHCSRALRPPPARSAELTVNIAQAVVHHSPAGFEWGYPGSGPADLALNILALFVPVGADGEEAAPLWRGSCSRFAWTYHQAFKREFIATMPTHGGVIYAEEIVRWIRERLPDYNPPEH